MDTGKAASVKDAVYYPGDNRIELVIKDTKGSYKENYRLEGTMQDPAGNSLAISAENLGITLETDPEPDTVSAVRVQYEKDGIPVYSLVGQSDITAVVKVVNSTGQPARGMICTAVCGTGAGAETFFSEPFDLEADSCKLVTVNTTGYTFDKAGDIQILLE